jgi:hypothetical protein
MDVRIKNTDVSKVVFHPLLFYGPGACTKILITVVIYGFPL